MSGHRLNFPSLELFDKKHFFMKTSIQKVKSSSLNVYFGTRSLKLLMFNVLELILRQQNRIFLKLIVIHYKSDGTKRVLKIGTTTSTAKPLRHEAAI